MRRQRTCASMIECSNMWPMCSEPVTFGGGITSEKYGSPGCGFDVVDVVLHPPLGPMRLEPLGLVNFIDFHGEIQF